MTDAFKIMMKDIKLAFKYDNTNFLMFLLPLFVSFLKFKYSNNVFTADIHIITGSFSLYTVSLIIAGLISKEEATKASLTIRNLPLKQSSIVIGRYLFTATIILIVSILSSLFQVIKSIMENDISYLILSIYDCIIFCIPLFSILFPLIFKFGYFKIHLIFIFINLCIVFTPYILIAFKVYNILSPVVDIIYNTIDIVEANYATVFSCSLILYILSLIVSVKTY